MELREFEEKLNEIRARNGWVINIEFRGLLIVTIEDKETGKKLAETGSTSIAVVLDLLEMPLNDSPWV